MVGNLWRWWLRLAAWWRGQHRYLSTGCLHGEHGHCRSAISIIGGPKEPGTCKFCEAVCLCPCHKEAS